MYTASEYITTLAWLGPFGAHACYAVLCDKVKDKGTISRKPKPSMMASRILRDFTFGNLK